MTTIVVSKKTRAKIESLKIHPKQTCDEIIDNIMSGKNLNEIKKTEKRINEAIIRSEEQMKRSEELMIRWKKLEERKK